MNTRELILECDGSVRQTPDEVAVWGFLAFDRDGREIWREAGWVPFAHYGSSTRIELEGVIAGMQWARNFAPGASIEVRTDASRVIALVMAPAPTPDHPLYRMVTVAGALWAELDVQLVWVPRTQNRRAHQLCWGISRALSPHIRVRQHPPTTARPSPLPGEASAPGPWHTLKLLARTRQQKKTDVLAWLLAHVPPDAEPVARVGPLSGGA